MCSAAQSNFIVELFSWGEMHENNAPCTSTLFDVLLQQKEQENQKLAQTKGKASCFQSPLVTTLLSQPGHQLWGWFPRASGTLPLPAYVS